MYIATHILVRNYTVYWLAATTNLLGVHLIKGKMLNGKCGKKTIKTNKREN